ncbi:hypothetical protein [Nesterenkonia pannonica]|uniref:hypothetical protein n=1 Tax=Nesterenkonia pannonica TaxID=1548602 RepID=UPI0021644526|nr:hypothetical protein [Nesterenkonia pannonica]
MKNETAQAVIQKQAMQIANLTLQNTVAEVELDEAKADNQKLREENQKLREANETLRSQHGET